MKSHFNKTRLLNAILTCEEMRPAYFKYLQAETVLRDESRKCHGHEFTELYAELKGNHPEFILEIVRQ